MTTPIVRNAYTPRDRTHPDMGPMDKPAQQQFREECDINSIMKKYQKTGAIAHTNAHEASYGFASSLDYQDSINLVMKADQMFKDLPSSLRKKFGNDPENYLDFVQDPGNINEMIDLGLAIKKKTSERVKTTPGEEEKSPPKAAEKGASGESKTEE